MERDSRRGSVVSWYLADASDREEAFLSFRYLCRIVKQRAMYDTRRTINGCLAVRVVGSCGCVKQAVGRGSCAQDTGSGIRSSSTGNLQYLAAKQGFWLPRYGIESHPLCGT